MRFYISAAHKSSGKSTISIGLSAALDSLGHTVQTFKRGPDYIDPIWLAQASGRPCYNLDFYSMPNEEILAQFHAHPADIQLVEGNKGLFDGLNPDGSDSNAALANLLDLPVVLVVDCTGSTRGIAPLLQGYQQFDHPKAYIAGVVLNKLGGSRHASKLRTAVEQYTDLPVLGAVPRRDDIAITERHLGLIPSNELGDTRTLIATMQEVIKDHIDIAQLLAATYSKQASQVTTPASVEPIFTGLRIGVAQDEAFGFYYAKDLQTFKELGAQIISFSPLHEATLPKNLDGLFLGGGFPETHAKQLAANSQMLASLQQAIRAGLPCYAECGGMMILASTLQYQGNTYPMADVIEAECVMQTRPQGRGYVDVISQPSHPWAPAHSTIHAHEFHYSKLRNFKRNYDFAYQVTRGDGIVNQQDGLRVYNLLASYTHLKHSAQFPWVQHFLNFCQQHKHVAD